MPLRFDGRSILIVEDEPLIAIDLVQAFQDAGAKVTMATTLEKAQLPGGG
jgi:DNA-binding response OmpR family regulator